MIQVLRLYRHGLEVFQVRYNGMVIHEYLSREQALTAKKRLIYKLFQGIR